MFDKYEGMPEQDVLMMMLDVLKRQSSIERIGDDILGKLNNGNILVSVT